MVEELTLEPEVIEIFEQISLGENFLLSGGAGSGKTYSLVQVIREVIRSFPTAKVACMTFTNAAVKEIEDRVNHSNLNVTTIHDFLWDCIKSFQKELKKTLIELINDETIALISLPEGNIDAAYFDTLENGIQYKEWLSLKDGIISHDELIFVSNRMFTNYSVLSDIVKDKFKFIFIDEYQDTHPLVVQIFLDQLKNSKKKNIIGFFGDSMQSIYDDGIGNLDIYKGIEVGKVKEIKKEQNRRSPLKVIGLANKLRTDGLQQVPSDDPHAPNMVEGKVKDGAIIFLHSTDDNVENAKQYLTVNYGWSFDDAKETKELNLTHNLIAEKADFKTLMDIYDKDLVLSFKDRIKKHIKDKAILTDFSEMTFGQVIKHLQIGKSGRDLTAVSPTNSMQVFIDNNVDLFNDALEYNYSTLSKMYVKKDQLIDDKKQHENDEKKKGSKRDNLVRHLFKIQNNISLYKEGRYNEFLRATDYRHRLKRVADKIKLKENIEKLINVNEKSIEEIISESNEMGITIIDDRLTEFKSKHQYLYNRVKNVRYKEFQNLYEYLEGKTPFSTQHKTKGTEFNNVLVVLDNGGWNNYNFEYLFLNKGTQSVVERTQKIFYVCCTRSKENLAVFYHLPHLEVVNKAIEWFGQNNVIKI